jgi:hypothetical protein
MGTGFYKYKRPVNNKSQFFSSTKELTEEKIHIAYGFDVPQRLKNFCTQKPFCLYTRAKGLDTYATIFSSKWSYTNL